MIRVFGRIQALARTIRYLVGLPYRALTIVSAEGCVGFRVRFNDWSRRLASGHLARQIAVPQGGRSNPHNGVYSGPNEPYLAEIRWMLERGQVPLLLSDKDSVDVVIPIFNAYDEFLRCVHSVLKYQDIYRIILLNDCSTDTRVSDLLRTLQTWGQGRLRVVTNAHNQGYLRTVNKGMGMTDSDVILLNTDTVVSSGWARKMKACAYSEDRVATVTPFTNNGRMCSIPEFLGNNEIPKGFTVDSFAECVENASSNRYPELVTGVGFCLYIRRSVIEEIGCFDEVKFETGYGEEVDFSFRATRKGYKNLLCDNAFVFHKGGASFLDAQRALMERHHRVLAEEYPDLWAAIAQFEQSNPLKGFQDDIKREIKTRRSRVLGSH
jgi:O-antigen biosynthesis protein